MARNGLAEGRCSRGMRRGSGNRCCVSQSRDKPLLSLDRVITGSATSGLAESETGKYDAIRRAGIPLPKTVAGRISEQTRHVANTSHVGGGMERVIPERRKGMQGRKPTYRIADCIAIPSKTVLGGGHVALTSDSGGDASPQGKETIISYND